MSYVFIDVTVTDEYGKRLGKTRLRADKNKIKMTLLKLRQAAKEVTGATKIESIELGDSQKTKESLEKKKLNRPALWDSKTPFGI